MTGNPEKPFATISAGAEKYEARVDNTSVFNHLGHIAIYDHVFVVVDKNRGIYVWAHNNGYDAFAALCVEMGVELHLNRREVSEVDKRAYDKEVLGDLKDFNEVPAEWLEEGEKHE